LIPHQDFQFRRLSQGEGGLRERGHPSFARIGRLKPTPPRQANT
jgi:hypothetical protein